MLHSLKNSGKSTNSKISVQYKSDTKQWVEISGVINNKHKKKHLHVVMFTHICSKYIFIDHLTSQRLSSYIPNLYRYILISWRQRVRTYKLVGHKVRNQREKSTNLASLCVSEKSPSLVFVCRLCRSFLVCNEYI